MKTLSDSIPSELKRLHQWALHRGKAPYQPNGLPAKSNNPATWNTFDECLKALDSGRFDGLGIMLGNGLVGVDADSAIDRQGQIEPKTEAIVGRLASYTERSISGRGLHVLAFGKLPEGRRRMNGWEMYDGSRFFVVTGAHLAGTPTTVEDRTVELATIHAEIFGVPQPKPNGHSPQGGPSLSDSELITKAMGARNGIKFSQLWAGGTADYPSPSEADLALCSMLAFYAGPDPAAVDRLFRQSGLMRNKWDERHFANGQTYGYHTIDVALSGKTDFYHPRGSRSPEFEDIHPDADPPPPDEPTSPDSQTGNQQAEDQHDEEDNDASARGKKSQGTILTEIAQHEYQFFHDAAGTPFAIVMVNGHPEVIPLRTTEFRALLAARFAELHKTTPGTRGVEEAVRVLTKTALYDAPEREVFTRVGKRGRDIVLDLCNDKRECVIVDAIGWRLEKENPILFRRARGMQALPTPTRGGRLKDLAKVINLAEKDLPLLAAWLVFAFNPDGPYPILVLRAEQGSGKSMTTRMVKALIDPNHTPPRAEPRDIRDLMIATKANLIVAFDNLSNLADWLSDGLCRLATGGGFGTRQLYEDDLEITFVAKRPVVMNAIGDPSTRGDFLSRALIIDLPAISGNTRMDEKEINTAFEEMRPAILGALLDAVSVALAKMGTTKLTRLPRMADFARWSTAAEKELGFTPGGFMDAYGNRQAETATITVDSSLVASVLMKWLPTDGWTGKVGQLFKEIGQYADAYLPKSTAQNLPKAPGWLSNELRRLAPALREMGLDVCFRQRGKAGTTVVISRIAQG